MASYYRSDGVRITHDPYAPEMAAKYGKPGQTDREGFDPYADTVGPGIYGGIIKRSPDGSVVIGKQYQNHNPRPGPVYAGGGYTPINQALGDSGALEKLLERFPDLANDTSTGGASPLHMCGMGGNRADAVEILVQHGADVEALDTYGFTPLHRMASNNLARAGQKLLEAGCDPNTQGACGSTPRQVALSSHASDFLRMLEQYPCIKQVPVERITVLGAGNDQVNGEYTARPISEIPEKFALVCDQNQWDTKEMWEKLAVPDPGCIEPGHWYQHQNKSYVYFNKADKHWWLDGPDGLGVYKSRGPRHAVPGYTKGCGGSFGWFSLAETSNPVPTLLIWRKLLSR